MDQVLNLVMAGVVGLVIGGLFMYFFSSDKKSETSVKAVEDKLENYQQDVEAHFAKTADLIDNLTGSYQEVFEHLSASAEKLLTKEQIQNQLVNRKSREVTIKYLKNSDSTETLSEEAIDKPSEEKIEDSSSEASTNPTENFIENPKD